MATPRDIKVGLIAARNWLNINESFYSGSISDDILTAVVKTVLGAVDTDRLKVAKAAHPATPGTHAVANTTPKA